MLSETSVAMTSLMSTLTGPSGAAGAGRVASAANNGPSRANFIRPRNILPRVSALIADLLGTFPSEADDSLQRVKQQTPGGFSFLSLGGCFEMKPTHQFTRKPLRTPPSIPGKGHEHANFLRFC